MGTAPSHQKTLSITNDSSTTTIKVINSINGQLQEFQKPVTAKTVLYDHQPDMFFLCNSEDMFVNCHVPHVPPDEELQMGQLYFIMPMSRLHRPVSLQELCLLAIKASAVLEKSLGSEKKKMMMMSRTTSLSGRRKRNGSVRRRERVDFQVALKKL